MKNEPPFLRSVRRLLNRWLLWTILVTLLPVLLLWAVLFLYYYFTHQ